MKIVDLHLDPGLKGWLIDELEDATSDCQDILIAKGPLNGEGPDAWSLAPISREMAEAMKKTSDHIYIKADGLSFLSVQPGLIHELEGKYMDWGENGPCLTDR